MHPNTKKNSLEIMHQKSDTGMTFSSWRYHSSMIGHRRRQSQGQKGAESVDGDCQQEQCTWGTARGERGGPERSLKTRASSFKCWRTNAISYGICKSHFLEAEGRNGRNQQLSDGEKGRHCGRYGSRNRRQEEYVQETAANDNIFF